MGLFGRVSVSQRRWNWTPWIGFLVCLLGFVSYFLLFDRYPVTRDLPWVNFLLFATGIVLLFVGLRRAFGQSQQYRGKVAGPILSLLSVAVVGAFCFTVFYGTRQLPRSAGAPRVGQKAPEFVLPDTNNKQVSLSSLLSAPLERTQNPPKGVLLIFYRGYW
jgi:hypothetical protein